MRKANASNLCMAMRQFLKFAGRGLGVETYIDPNTKNVVAMVASGGEDCMVPVRRIIRIGQDRLWEKVLQLVEDHGAAFIEAAATDLTPRPRPESEQPKKPKS